MAMKLSIVSLFDPRGVNQATSGLDKLGKIAGGFGIAAGAAFAAAAAGAVAFGISSIEAADKSQQVSRSLEQIAKNSGAFGKTASEVRKSVEEITSYTTELSKLTGIDDEILNSIVRGWMAVPELASKGVKGLEDMVKVVADVAAGTGKDVTAIGAIFTKVAGDESTAMGKLQKAGIVLSNSQKQIYADTLASNGEIAAQDYLVQTLGETYAGAAQAASSPFERLKAILEDFQETLGTAFLPAIEDAIPVIQQAVEAFVASPEFVTFVDDASASFQTMLEFLPEIFDTLTSLGTDALPILNSLLPTFNNLIDLASGGMDGLATGSGNAFKNLSDVAYVIKAITDAGVWLDDWLKGSQKTWGDWGAFVKSVADTVGFAFNPVFTTLSRIVDFIKYITGQPIDLTQYGYVPRPSNSSAPGGPRPMATGGIVMQPLNALVGEAGPEAIIPLDRLGSMGTNVNVTVNTVAGDPVAIERIVLDAISRANRRGDTRLVA